MPSLITQLILKKEYFLILFKFFIFLVVFYPPHETTAQTIFQPKKGQYKKKYKIKHPLQKKGLIKINKDKVYFYTTPESKFRGMFSLKIGFGHPGNLIHNGFHFEEIYEKVKTTPWILFDYEWPFLKNPGIFSIKAGSGFFVPSDRGIFESSSTINRLDRAQEKVTFFLFPHNIALVYRFKFFKKQFIVPYAEGGADIFTFLETKRGKYQSLFKSDASYGIAYLAHWAAGGQLNLGTLNRNTAINLDREYGINNLYLNFEYRQYLNLGSALNFSSNVMAGGIVVEF